VGEPLDQRPVDYWLLMLLHANPPLTPKQLTQALALSLPNLIILLDKMQQRGAIEHVSSLTETRSQHILCCGLPASSSRPAHWNSRRAWTRS
jgi:DNA-binding MarR family transcriptional regulator